MLLDHMGYLLFPSVIWLRAVGRLALPIFAFMISEGAKYTKNRLRYFLTVLIFGVVCQTPYILMENDWHLNIFLTFALSILIIYSLDYFKKCMLNRNCKITFKALSLLLLLVAIVGTLHLNTKILSVHFDYGFYGCIMAVFASIPTLNGVSAPEWVRYVDNIPVRILCMLFPLFIFSHSVGGYQYASLLALPLLLLYSGKRGKYNMKYFFYFFYPLHIVIIYGISLLF